MRVHINEAITALQNELFNVTQDIEEVRAKMVVLTVKKTAVKQMLTKLESQHTFDGELDLNA